MNTPPRKPLADAGREKPRDPASPEPDLMKGEHIWGKHAIEEIAEIVDSPDVEDTLP